MTRVACRAITALGLSLGAVTPAGALLDAGPEFQVNTYTTGPQREPAVAGRSDGSFVVTWRSGAEYGYHDAPNDSAAGVFLQRFDAAGGRVGGEQHVNTFTTSDQRRPAVSARGDGAFVVVWESGCAYAYGNSECTPDGSRRAVALQRFDPGATPLGSELVVNTSTLGNQYDPSVASAPTGEFVVTWASRGSGYPVPDQNQVLARRYAADGSPAGDEFQVDTSTLGYQGLPAIAMDGAGNFVVVWEEYAGESSAALTIRGRRFDASGAPLGEFIVASATAYGSLGPAVAAAATGEFVVTWQAYYYFDVVKGGEVHARRFAADGTPLGPSFAVNSYVPGGQFAPKVASDAAGNFLVSWTSDSYSGTHSQDGDASGVFAQAFARDGAPLGSEVQVNAFTTARQNDAAVGVAGPGEFVVAWTSAPYYGGAPQDGDGPGIFARKLALHPCAGAGDCEDGNPCTTDACEDGRCLNRRQPDCCQAPGECYDGDPCTDDLCMDTVCTFPPRSGCVRCARDTDYCAPPNTCFRAACNVDVGRCEYTRKAGCCLVAADCDDGLACTFDQCSAANTCTTTPIAGCVGCSGDAECSTGCLVGPETCVAGRCESPPGCPVVAIEGADPFGAAGKLLASVEVPAEAPGKGKVKVVITATIGALESGDTPSRRCKSGKTAGRGSIVIAPGSTANVLLALTKAGMRCLAADPDGVLPIDVMVRVVRKKTPLSEVTTSRTWRR